MDESLSYQSYLEKTEEDYEALCRRCGGCCGVYENDPCTKLARDEDGRWRCSDYENRLGMHKTIHGNEFKCASARDVRFGSWPGSCRCGYKKSVHSQQSADHR